MSDSAPASENPEAYAFPLSLNQEQLWFLYQAAPNSAVYNIPVDVRFDGLVEPAALRLSLAVLVRRHDSLRTHFGVVDGEPRQIVCQDGDLDWNEVDLSGHKDPDAEWNRRAHRLAKRPFDLEKGPLFRAEFGQVGPKAFRLCFVIHHIVSDGWSLQRLFGELSCAYSRFVQHDGGNVDDALPELCLQYPDFAVWQRQVFGSLRTGSTLRLETNPSLSYWKDVLGDAPHHLHLGMLSDGEESPSESSGTLGAYFAGSHVRHAFEASLLSDLKASGAGSDATLYAALHAAVVLLLHKYTGRPEVVVAVPFAGRTQPELEAATGLFVNTLPLRTRVNASASPAAILRDVQSALAAAQKHQHTPLDAVYKALGVKRGGANPPFMDVMVEFQEAPVDADAFELVTTESRWLRTDTAKFALTISFEVRKGALYADLEYDTSVLQRSDVQTIAADLETACAAVARARSWAPDEMRETVRDVSIDARIRIPEQSSDSSDVPLDRTPPTGRQAPSVDSRRIRETERTLSDIWAQVLGRTDFDPDDNFFDLGGDSLLLTRVQIRIEERLSMTVSTIDLLQYSTVRALAIHLQEKRDPTPEMAEAKTNDETGGRLDQLSQGLHRLRQSNS